MRIAAVRCQAFLVGMCMFGITGYAAHASDSKTEKDGFYWKAWSEGDVINKAATLHVAGVFKAPSPGHYVVVEPAKPQGINPKILILDVKDQGELPGAWPDVQAGVPAVYELAPYSNQYEGITIKFPNGKNLDIKIIQKK